jgi:hypothetical protein
VFFVVNALWFVLFQLGLLPKPTPLDWYGRCPYNQVARLRIRMT